MWYSMNAHEQFGNGAAMPGCGSASRAWTLNLRKTAKNSEGMKRRLEHL